MHPPDELMVEDFLPAMRLLVARELSRQGYSQSRVAALLGMTQASVSLYLSSDSAKAYGSLAAFQISTEEADSYARALADDAKRKPAYAVETLGGIWLSVLGKGQACDAHRLSYPSLADCDVCIRAYGGHGDRGVETISEVNRALKLIESSRTFAKAMPEVSVNLACVSGDSRSPDDVVAIPGRIVRVRGSARATREPEFGASGHMARMLLLARARRKEFRAAINLRYDGRMARVVKKLRLTPIELADRGDASETTDALSRSISRARGAFDAVVDRGGKGIEPNLYLFGKGAVGVARLAVRASELYSAG